ncbi:MAG: hypothetical protein K9J13_15555 [Saprospiraceae bacterium]|nr:hypothetical protein [Saprospiraceae bacterium]
MNNLDKLIEDLEYKARKLVESKQKTENENSKLLNDISELKKIINKQKLDINKLEENNKVLKIAKSIDTGEESVNAKQKINELVREVDKCIALLNK